STGSGSDRVTSSAISLVAISHPVATAPGTDYITAHFLLDEFDQTLYKVGGPNLEAPVINTSMAYAPLDLTGKIAVVIGGTSGIGRAIAHGLAEAGADVVPTSRRAEQVDSAAKEIEEPGRRSLRISSDVSDRSSL